jgi:hypothetical protein
MFLLFVILSEAKNLSCLLPSPLFLFRLCALRVSVPFVLRLSIFPHPAAFCHAISPNRLFVPLPRQSPALDCPERGNITDERTPEL